MAPPPVKNRHNPAHNPVSFLIATFGFQSYFAHRIRRSKKSLRLRSCNSSVAAPHGFVCDSGPKQGRKSVVPQSSTQLDSPVVISDLFFYSVALAAGSIATPRPNRNPSRNPTYFPKRNPSVCHSERSAS
jgi:hypothetical protein